jgi:FkbM family methyltransferase
VKSRHLKIRDLLLQSERVIQTILKSILNISVNYKVGGGYISLPAFHLLPLYQSQHRLYDRFLPHLVGFLETNSVVIDVGANCGDTLAAMYDSNKTLNYVCIEPDDLFFSFLNKNISRIKTENPNASVKAIQALVGRDVTGVALDGSGGTKRAVFSNGQKNVLSKTLDAIAEKELLKNVALLKSDVDGFDFDVLYSAEILLKANCPILYFECDMYNKKQNFGFKISIERLWNLGYKKWIVFDNFGSIILKDPSI